MYYFLYYTVLSIILLFGYPCLMNAKSFSPDSLWLRLVRSHNISSTVIYRCKILSPLRPQHAGQPEFPHPRSRQTSLSRAAHIQPSLPCPSDERKSSISDNFSSAVSLRSGALWGRGTSTRSVLEPARVGGVVMELVEVLGVLRLWVLLLAQLLSVTATLWIEKEVEADVLEGCVWCRFLLWFARWW